MENKLNTEITFTYLHTSMHIHIRRNTTITKLKLYNENYPFFTSRKKSNIMIVCVFPFRK